MKNTFVPLASAALPLFILVFAFTINLSDAQLNGIVENELNKPVKNTEIVLNQNGYRLFVTHTNENGFYQFTNVKPGKYTISVSYKDYTAFNAMVQIDEGVILVKNFTVNSVDKTITERIGNKPIEIVEDDLEIGEIELEVMEESDQSISYAVIPVSKRQTAANFHNTEEYNYIQENGFKLPSKDALSTFSIDADGAAYANTRRFLKDGKLPPVDAVRIEEFINYFTYNYKEPTGDAPFSINTEVAVCPWNETHYLMHIGLKGVEKDKSEMPKNNLVFLLDVSGSMDSPDKLGLVKKSLKMMINQLNEDDRIAIVVYAGASGLALPSTKVGDKQKILEALNNLQAGGSTAGADGIKLAYKVAEENFLKNGNNRIVLCTDGDFNVGISSQSAMIKLIEEKRESGIFLSVFGFGMGNLKDSKMEQIANHGNGTYNYIDNLSEAQKVFVNEAGGTLLTIAKDVKIQVEFNPNTVAAYRLIGYENRLLNNEDFNDDTKDAGEIGAGHTITAIYEIVPAGVALPSQLNIDELKYQENKTSFPEYGNELATVKFRYKNPKESSSLLLSTVVENSATAFNNASNNMQFSAALAGWGMILRDSEHRGIATYNSVIEWAQAGRGTDNFGYRGEFVQLVRLAMELDERKVGSVGW